MQAACTAYQGRFACARPVVTSEERTGIQEKSANVWPVPISRAQPARNNTPLRPCASCLCAESRELTRRGSGCFHRRSQPSLDYRAWSAGNAGDHRANEPPSDGSVTNQQIAAFS
jgi:hypothetical protein